MSVAPTALHVEPAGGHLGATVRGLDLSRPLEPSERAELVGLLDQHLVLHFPEQDLDDDQQLAFALQLGGPYIHPLARGHLTEARCEHIVDDVDHPPYQDVWHTDVSWDDRPPTYGTLRAIDLPPRGGDTVFASMYAAYDALSPVMQAVLEPLRAVHTMGVGTAFVTKAGAEVVAKVREQFPGTEHPVVGVHPATGRRYLAVNAGFTEAIAGMTPAESRALLDLLVVHSSNPNFQYRHHWSPGDVVVWDERPTQHYAVADYLPNRREMGRVAVRV